MSDSAEIVKCDQHGESSATFVCTHLMADPVQRWFCNAPSEADRWPDAWCARCDAEFLREGEWNDKNSGKLDIKLLCSGCYESLRGRSIEVLSGQAAERWELFVRGAQNDLKRKQAQLDSEFEIGKHKRWDWEQERAELVFSTGGIPAVKCRIAFVGSVSTKSNTWLWSWANFSLHENVRLPAIPVREFGYEHDYPKLVVPKWNAEQVDGWEMAAVAAKVLDAKGVYRTPAEYGFMFTVILDAEWVQ